MSSSRKELTESLLSHSDQQQDNDDPSPPPPSSASTPFQIIPTLTFSHEEPQTKNKPKNKSLLNSTSLPSSILSNHHHHHHHSNLHHNDENDDFGPTNNFYELSSVKINRNNLLYPFNTNTNTDTHIIDGDSLLDEIDINNRRLYNLTPRSGVGVAAHRGIKNNYVDEQDEFSVARKKYPDGRYCVVMRKYLPAQYFERDYKVSISNFELFQSVLAEVSDIESLMWKKTTGQYDEADEKESCMVMCHVSDLIFECLQNRQEYLSGLSFKKEKKVDHQYYQSRYKRDTRHNATDEYFRVEDITFKQFTKNCCYAFLLLVTIFLFLLIASVPIWLIEGSYEAQQLNDLTANYTLANPNETAIVYDLFNIDHWYYTNCLYFSTVTFSTVGYGDVVPQTPSGKLFVLLFGILGLATIGAMTGVLGKKLIQNTKSVLTLISNVIIFIIKVCMSCSFKSTHRKTTRIEQTVSVVIKHPISQIFYFLFLFSVYSLLGAAIFTAFEGWALHDSLYFVFITLTTIGYGDLKLKHTGSKFFLIFFLMCGIGLLGILLALIGGVFKRLLSKIYMRTTSQRENHEVEDFLNVKSVQENMRESNVGRF